MSEAVRAPANLVVEAASKISKARGRLVVAFPWFGTLALNLRVVYAPDLGVERMATDGTTLYYDPEWVNATPADQIEGVICHETLHCGLLHPYRMGARDHARFNAAADEVVNRLLVKQGVPLPSDSLGVTDPNPAYDGLSVEQVYELLPKPPPCDQAGGGGGAPRPKGDVLPAPKPSPSGSGETGNGKTGSGAPEPRPSNVGHGGAPQPPGTPMTAVDWQIAVEQASMVARGTGAVSADVDRATRAARESRQDWREVLRQFVEDTVPRDYSWATPNRRFLAHGLYLPGVTREGAPRLGVGVDCSGSISAALLAIFATELTAIVRDVRPESLDIAYFDTMVKRTQSVTPDDDGIVFEAAGGGGTRFGPVLDHFAEADEPPVAVLMLTDLLAPKPPEPDFPVLWVVPEGCTKPAPFGERVVISLYD